MIVQCIALATTLMFAGESCEKGDVPTTKESAVVDSRFVEIKENHLTEKPLEFIVDKEEELRKYNARQLKKKLAEDAAKEEADKKEALKRSRVLDIEATFYTARCTGCTGITKMGHNVRNTIYAEGYRVIAVDPTLIKLGSLVRVTLNEGQSFVAIASDIGGDIKGLRIDVLVSTEEEAYRLGRQQIKVEILGGN